MNFELSEATRDQLENLRAMTGADSMSAVLRRALAVYQALVSEQAKGAEPVLRYSDGKEKTLLLAE